MSFASIVGILITDFLSSKQILWGNGVWEHSVVELYKTQNSSKFIIYTLSSPIQQQIKDILKGSLRFNQSQLEAEENEQITIADDHYCSNSQNKGTGDVLKGPVMTKQQFISGQQVGQKYLRQATDGISLTILDTPFVMAKLYLGTHQLQPTSPVKEARSSQKHNLFLDERWSGLKHQDPELLVRMKTWLKVYV